MRQKDVADEPESADVGQAFTEGNESANVIQASANGKDWPHIED